MVVLRLLSQRATAKPRVSTEHSPSPQHVVQLFSTQDNQVLRQFHLFPNNPKALVLIVSPAVVSLLLCPLTLLLHDQIMYCFWPDSNGQVPKINDGISCFLTPAGLVYAIAFGFAFQEAIRKQNDLSNRMSTLVNKAEQICVMCSQVSVMSSAERMRVVCIVKGVTLDWMCLVMGNVVDERRNESNKNLKYSGESFKNLGSVITQPLSCQIHIIVYSRN